MAINPLKQIWIAYNHLPGGHIVVQHFEDIIRKKRISAEDVQEIEFSAETQIKGFQESDFVACYVNGKLEKNKVLFFPQERDLRRNARAANVVIEWAKEQGMTPIPPASQPKREPEKTVVIDPRVSEIEKELSATKDELAQARTQAASTDAKVDKILAMLQNMQPKKEEETPDAGGE